MAFEDGVFATFYDKAVQNKSKTRDEGFPVFEEVLYIKIVVPNQIDVVPRPARDEDKKRFPKSWEAYQTGKEAPQDGYPLKEWAQITASELKVCLANHVKTVEQLAATPDSTIHRLGMGGQSMKQRAKKFLEQDNDTAALRKENEELKKRIAKLEAGSKPARKRLKVAK